MKENNKTYLLATILFIFGSIMILVKSQEEIFVAVTTILILLFVLIAWIVDTQISDD